jgi:anthranilate phosphoribosyltransferase
VHTYILRVEDVGLKPAPYSEITGGTAQQNALTARAILAGQVQGAKCDAVALNAGAAFYLAGKTRSIAEGVEVAQQILDEGKGLELLEQLVHFTQA